GVERAQLVRGHVDAADLAAVLEMAGDVRLRHVERPALEQLRQPRARLAPLAGRRLLAALGLDALVLLALRADGIGLREVDLLPGAAGLRRPLRLLRAALAGIARLARVARGLRRRLEAEAEQLVAEGIAHGPLSSGAGAARRRDRRRTAGWTATGASA